MYFKHSFPSYGQRDTIRFISIIALVVGAMVITTGGIMLFDFVKEKDVTTTVTVQDGLKCTINGDPVINGAVVITNAENKICIHVESTGNAFLAFSGSWHSDKKDVCKSDVLETAATSADFCIKLDRQNFTGKLAVYIDGSDDLAPINLTFNFDESQVKVTAFGAEVKNGQIVSFPNDGHFTIESKIGKANIHYDYSWSNEYGMSGSGSWDELNTSISGTVENMCYFSAGTGPMNISAHAES